MNSLPRPFAPAFLPIVLAAAFAFSAPSSFAQESAETPPLAEMELGGDPAAPTSGPNTEGFFVEFCGNSNHIGNAEDRDENDGPNDVFVGENAAGGTIVLAYGFSPSFPLRFSISGAEHNTTDPDVKVSFASVTLEGGYIFRAGTPVRPYLYGGLGAFSLSSRQDEYDYETTGPGVDFGFGLYSFLGEHFVIDAALRFDFVNWETQTATIKLPNGDTATVETPVNDEGAASKILLGAGWWF